jgi:tape measure domain-containing protein
MAEKIADYFGSLGFQVNDKGLKEFIKQLDNVAKKMQAVTKLAVASSGASGMSLGMQKLATDAKKAADGVEKATTRITRSQAKLGLVGKKAADIPATGSLASFRSRVLLLNQQAKEDSTAKATLDRLTKMKDMAEQRDALRLQRRQERMTSEDERRYQNRVSRTYAPKTSRLDLYQKDLARTQMMYNAALAAGDGSAKRYAEAIKKLRGEITSLNRQTMFGKMGLKGFGGGLGGLGSALVPMLGMAAAGGAAGLGYSAVALNQQLVEKQNINAQFEGLYGGAAQGKAGYGRFKDYANQRGVRAGDVAQDYLGFMYSAKTNLGLEGGEKIFQQFTDFARVRGTSGERYKRALAALSQMVSKNRIYSEELTQQLSEHLFGSKEIFAETITGKKGGDAMQELMKQMKSDKGVTTSDWLPKVTEKMQELAKESGVLDKMSNNLDATLARLNNRWGDFIGKMEEVGVADAMGRFIEMLTGKLDILEDFIVENKDSIIKLMDAFTGFVDFITSKEFVLIGLTATFTALGVAIKTNAVWMGILTGPATLAGIGSLIKAMWSLAAAQAVAFAPWLWLAAMIATTLLVLEDFYYWVNGKPSLMGELFGDADDMFKGLDQFFEDMKKKWDEVTAEMAKMWEKFKSTVSKPFEWLGKKWDDVSKGAGEMMNDMGIRTSIVANAPMVTGQQNKPAPTYQINGVTVIANDPQSFYKGVERETLKYPRGGYK